MVQTLWKTVWRFLKKVKLELPYNPAIPLLDIYPEKITIQKDTFSPMFTVALFTIVKTWKQPKYSTTDEWIKKMWYIYTMEYYSVIKKSKLMPLTATWIQLQMLILSQKGKDKHDITYTWNLKYETNELTYKTEADSWT